MMKKFFKKNNKTVLSVLIIGVSLFFTFNNTSGQTVFNNDLIRIGNGSENSINNSGNMQQPFYYNSVYTAWRKLTYSSYPLDNSFAVGGDGTNEWNLNGTMVNNPSMTSQVIDLSGYVVSSSPNGYGTIISTGTINVGGYNLEIKNTYEMGQDKSFIKITTNVKNISGMDLNNIRYWVGTRDDYVGGTDVPKKEKGNLVDGAFVKITDPADRALALRISTSDEGILFYTNSSKGNNIINSCCSWTNVTNQNPQTSTIEVTNDGSYGFYVRLNDLLNGDNDEFTWYYAAGELDDLEDIVADVAAASGAVSDISYTDATFKAKTTFDGTGYWMIVPRGATAPTELDIKNGTNYGSVTVTSSGSGAMTADVETLFELTGLTPGTDYDLYFVAENAASEFTAITNVQFSAEAYTVPTVITTAATDITLISATSGGVVTDNGGQSVTAYGVCWNTSGTPTISDNKTTDGSGTESYTSSLTGLTEGTTYYIRAYATNSVGTAYGSQVSMTTLSTSISGSTGGTATAFNSPVYIASSATINGTTLTGVSVSIYNNYSSSQDVLGIDGATSGTEGSISYSFNSTTGILSINGSADATDYQAIIRKLTYTNTSATPSTLTRSIKISLNTALPFDGNGHYYEYVTSSSITWSAAKTAASNMKYFGLQGYLVTITSAEESAFCASKLLGQGWLGASDESSEGTWRWVAGPENGTVLTYTHWNSGEPNDAGGNEDCAQFLANGLWNDLSSTATLTGYVVEYGGMAGDPVLDISDNVTVTFTIPTATAATNIAAESFTANWTAVSGATGYFLDIATNSSFSTLVSGYSNKDVGNVTTYNVTGLNPNTAYYYRIRATFAAGTSFNSSVQSLTTLKRTQTITFDALDNVTYGVADFDLTATASSGLTVTYVSSNTGVAVISGGTVSVVGVGNTTITASQSGNTSYYAASDVQQTLSVDKATLTVTAEDQTKVYGEENPTLTFAYSGFVNGDDAGDLATEPASSTSVSVTSPVDVYTGAITIDGGADENYSFSYVAADFEVTKAVLTVTADDQTKVYGDANPTLTFQYSGFMNGDDEEDLATEPVASTTVSETTSVDVYTDDITLGGGVDENYSFSYVAADFEVTKATLTVTADSQTKVYGDANPTLTFQYSGFVNDDDEEDLTTKPVTSTTVSETTSVGTYTDDITLAGGDDENYSFSYVAADFEVTKAELTVTADNQTKVYGDANPTLTFQYSGFVNDDDYTDLTTVPMASTSVSATTSVNVYTDDITLDGGVDENYSFSYIAADFEVTKATLTVTADSKTKVYGDPNPSLTFQYSGFVNGDDAGDLATEPEASTPVSLTSPVDVYTDAITIEGGADENYSFSYVAADFEVTKATLTVTADSQTKVYGDPNPSLTFQYSGFVNGDDAGDLATEPAASTSVSVTSPVDVYTDAITIDGGADENYSFSYVAADFEVTKATLTVTADSQTKVYGDVNPTLSFKYNGFMNDDKEEDLTAIPVPASTITVTSSVGVYSDNITLSGGDDENYSFTYVAADFEVTKATLTVTADDQTKVYGGVNPTLTFAYSGFVNGDDAGDLATEPEASTPVSLTSPVDVYTDAITIEGGADENYSFSYVAADFEVTKATLTVTADSQTKVYGEENPVLTFAYSGFVNGDDAGDLTTEPEASTPVSVTSPVDVYTDAITIDGGADENYSFSYVAGDFEVKKAPLTVAADNQTKVYGDSNPELTFQYSGFVNGDDEEDLATVPSASTEVSETTSVDLYNDAITIDDGADENYSFSYVAGDFEVTKATLTARAENKTKIFGNVNPAITIRYSGFKNDDEISDIDILPVASTEAEQNSDAGIYDITVAGGEDANYKFDYIYGTITIDKADQEIAFANIPEGLRMTEQYRFNAAASSGLALRFESSDPEAGSISGDILTIKADRTFSVTAYQDGDNNWNPAQEVTKWVTGLPTFDNIMSLFTPNNDGMNDYWYITDIEEYGNVSVTIYNRYGKKVYESHSYNNNWDGLWNGKPLPSASYYYIIKSENKGTINGVVNLVR
jgi:gliding motility-associated-like protein